MNAKSILIASTAAMLLVTGTVTARAQDTMSSGKQVSCFGINSCKGQSACKSVHNDCKGKNACKAQGKTVTTPEDCSSKGGTVMDEGK